MKNMIQLSDQITELRGSILWAPLLELEKIAEFLVRHGRDLPAPDVLAHFESMDDLSRAISDILVLLALLLALGWTQSRPANGNRSEEEDPSPDPLCGLLALLGDRDISELWLEPVQWDVVESVARLGKHLAKYASYEDFGEMEVEAC